MKVFLTKVSILANGFEKRPVPVFLSLMVFLIIFMGGYLINQIKAASDSKDKEIVYLKAEIKASKLEIVSLSNKIDTLKINQIANQEKEIEELKAIRRASNHIKNNLKK